MHPILKVIAYVSSILCFIIGGLALWDGIKPKTPSYRDYYFAEFVGKTIEEYFFDQMIFGIGVFIVFLFIGVGILVGITRKPIKQEPR